MFYLLRHLIFSFLFLVIVNIFFHILTHIVLDLFNYIYIYKLFILHFNFFYVQKCVEKFQIVISLKHFICSPDHYEMII